MSRSVSLSFAISALAVVVLPAGAAAQAPAPPASISAVGSATVEVTPEDRRSNTSIAAAVTEAQLEALPLAIKAARVRAGLLASTSNLLVGNLIGIADTPPTPFGPYLGADGTFGPGRYCGTVARFRTKRLANGRIRRTRLGSRRTCRVPSRVGTSVTVTYATLLPAA